MTSTSLLALALAAVLGWGFLGDLFGSDAPSAPKTEAVAQAVQARLRNPRLHEATPDTYTSGRPHWRDARVRHRLAAILDEATADGVRPDEVHADVLASLRRALAASEREWAALDGDARDSIPDPRPGRLASLDVAITDGLLRLGDALRGRRVDPRQLYPVAWFPTRRDSADAGFDALAAAVRAGDADAAEAALDALRPQNAGYRRLRARLAALEDDLAPIPAGPNLRKGRQSVRVPHLRARLTALGYLAPDTLGVWDRPHAYTLDDSLAVALARFEEAQRLPADGILDAAATDALNADPEALRREIVLNLERWRWLPDDLGDRFVWVNLPAFELRVLERDSAGYAERLRMPVNIGNALTTGWTTPVITDSIAAVEFQPVWYVPSSLAAANVFPMAQRDSLALWRAGIEAFQNGRPVDTRLVPWDSVSVGEFRFQQRPGPANPLGRVKFLMHNPFAILIHDTNKRYTFEDGAGSSMSSGCVQASAPDRLAEYLLTTVNGWEPGAATRSWRGGPRRGVRLERPFLTHFTYFTAWAEPDGRLKTYADPYGYDARLADALGLGTTTAAAPQPTS